MKRKNKEVGKYKSRVVVFVYNITLHLDFLLGGEGNADL